MNKQLIFKRGRIVHEPNFAKYILWKSEANGFLDQHSGDDWFVQLCVYPEREFPFAIYTRKKGTQFIWPYTKFESAQIRFEQEILEFQIASGDRGLRLNEDTFERELKERKEARNAWAKSSKDMAMFGALF